VASLVDDLNDLLARARAGCEAARLLAHEIERSDPDIDRGLEDIIDIERWSSSGLYHRITQLDGTPSLAVNTFPDRVAAKTDLRERLKMLCNEQEAVARQAKHVLLRDDLDQATRDLLTEFREVHLRNAAWCSRIMRQWEPDRAPGHGRRER